MDVIKYEELANDLSSLKKEYNHKIQKHEKTLRELFDVRIIEIIITLAWIVKYENIKDVSKLRHNFGLSETFAEYIIQRYSKEITEVNKALPWGSAPYSKEDEPLWNFIDDLEDGYISFNLTYTLGGLLYSDEEESYYVYPYMFVDDGFLANLKIWKDSARIEYEKKKQEKKIKIEQSKKDKEFQEYLKLKEKFEN